jgi:hypothetical protein
MLHGRKRGFVLKWSMCGCACAAYFESGSLVRPLVTSWQNLVPVVLLYRCGHKTQSTLYRHFFITPVMRHTDRPESISKWSRPYDIAQMFWRPIMISVPRISLLNLNISPFVFRRALLLKELVESKTRDNTLRFNNVQSTNNKQHILNVYCLTASEEPNFHSSVFMVAQFTKRRCVDQTGYCSANKKGSCTWREMLRACNSMSNVFRCVLSSVSRTVGLCV